MSTPIVNDTSTTRILRLSAVTAFYLLLMFSSQRDTMHKQHINGRCASLYLYTPTANDIPTPWRRSPTYYTHDQHRKTGVTRPPRPHKQFHPHHDHHHSIWKKRELGILAGLCFFLNSDGLISSWLFRLGLVFVPYPLSAPCATALCLRFLTLFFIISLLWESGRHGLF
ncbi:hypothetical protein B0J13DRAFT_111124 [Dactylonectria estremocensis]|uniref:Transmembrane protein n=1 Tax=Dactylonectria estremocensis TaxID=1079267 RepID=A0A9P9JI00_9HYPO|nr:hypothetical protein B0J13DRAFT_111124 [Dactylonectria estremocensis]